MNALSAIIKILKKKTLSNISLQFVDYETNWYCEIDIKANLSKKSDEKEIRKEATSLLLDEVDELIKLRKDKKKIEDYLIKKFKDKDRRIDSIKLKAVGTAKSGMDIELKSKKH